MVFYGLLQFNNFEHYNRKCMSTDIIQQSNLFIQYLQNK